MMRALLLAAGIALPLSGLAQDNSGEDLFSRLDRNGDGYLSSTELSSDVAPGSGWIAIDRDRGRAHQPRGVPAVRQGAAPPPRERVDTARWDPAELRGGYSARRLIGAPARDFYGEPAGVVRELLVNRNGAVTGLVINDSRVPWIRADIGPGAAYVGVPAMNASAGATRAPEPLLPQQGEWRATELLDDVVQIERGVRYGNVSDLVITPWGEVRAIVVDAGPLGEPGRYAYPWPRDARTPVRDLRPFDYSALGIAAPWY